MKSIGITSLLAASTVLALSGAAVAVAASGSGQPLSGALSQTSSNSNAKALCINRNDGTVRIIKDSESCKRGENKLSWPEDGKPGPRGPRGLPGLQGLTGDKGDQGNPAPVPTFSVNTCAMNRKFPLSGEVSINGNFTITALVSGGTYNYTVTLNHDSTIPNETIASGKISKLAAGSSSPIVWSYEGSVIGESVRAGAVTQVRGSTISVDITATGVTSDKWTKACSFSGEYFSLHWDLG